MKHAFNIVIIPEDNLFVARSLELGVVSQGKSAEEAAKNLKEALELYLEDLPKSELKKLLKPRKPAFMSTLELEYA